MAELQLIVPYRPVQTKVQLAFVCMILPIWSIFAPMLLAAFVTWLGQNPTSSHPFATQLICVTLFTIAVAGFFISALSEDDKIHVSKNGLSFPPFLLPYLKFRRNWLWEELRTAAIADTAQGRKLVLGFAPDTTLALNMADFKEGQLEELLLALELWGSKCERSPELIDAQRDIQNKTKGLIASTTKMWQEELGRRFTATTFVPLEPGRELQNGRLKIVRQLAFGGLSAIYLAQKSETDLFVLKEAVVPSGADAEAREKAEAHLVRESKILAGLQHPNIARVLDNFVEDGRNYLLMEYIHGQDLRQYVKQNGAFTEKQVHNYARKIAELLKFLHENDPPVVHRDLTPDNLVLKNDGTIVLIDFGASNEFVGTATGTLVGKQAYIAPEQLRGKTVPQSDLYALGGTLHYLLTGRDPVPLAQADIRSILPDISPEMEELIKSLTAFEREERVESAARLLEILDGMQVSEVLNTRTLVGELE